MVPYRAVLVPKDTFPESPSQKLSIKVDNFLSSDLSQQARGALGMVA
jgi:hypothetical protein